MSRARQAQALDERGDLRLTQAGKLPDLADILPLEAGDGTGQALCRLDRPIGTEDEQRHGFPQGRIRHGKDNMAKEIQGGSISPVQVINDQENRNLLRQLYKDAGYCEKLPQGVLVRLAG